MSDDSAQKSHLLCCEAVKVIAESVGIQNIQEDVAKELSDDLIFRLKNIVQDCFKFKLHGKRKKLCNGDFDNSVHIKGFEPLYGIVAKEHIPFRFASGGGRELHFIEDKEIDISEMIASPSQRFPAQTVIKSHWLAIDGIQPSIPENPPLLTKLHQKKDSVDPALKLSLQTDKRDDKHIHGRGIKSIETVKVKQLATHELSAEQQLYYKEITEACVGSDEGKRNESLHSLAYDPGLYQMVPRLCTFIAEGVRVNVVQKNLALLIYLMRMAKALLDNQSLDLEKYLHEIVPPVMTCIVSKQLCLKPEVDNHWALRDFAARLISQICKTYNTTTNGLQTRITRVFSKCLIAESTPLSCVYGAIAGLSELGAEVVKIFVLPKLRDLGIEIEAQLENVAAFEKNAATHIKTLLLKTLAQVLKTTRNPPDLVCEYEEEFGCLGTQIHAAVIKARQTMTTVTTVASAPTVPAKSVTPSQIAQGSASRTFVMNKQPNQSQKVVVTPRNQQVENAKYVVITGPNQTQIKQEIKEEPIDPMSPTHDVHVL